MCVFHANAIDILGRVENTNLGVMLQMLLMSFYAELGHLAASGSNCITWGESVEEEDKCAEGRTFKSGQKAEESNPFWTDWGGTISRIEGKPGDSLAKLASIKKFHGVRDAYLAPSFSGPPSPGAKHVNENAVLYFPGLVW